MRNRILLPILLTGTLLGTAALASSYHVTGKIKEINAGTETLMLADGSVYQIPNTVKTDGFKVGDKVVVEWDMVGTAHQLISLAPA
ncbi:DUF1344 domain-containing protein [Neotabrizicola sp. VNH66]|uniref:DUF1344 domain-containing protein n=1 Tax=Neotabrizicola sp. VNH66 TaxID=3400918 RepID=UPI003BFAF7A2